MESRHRFYPTKVARDARERIRRLLGRPAGQSGGILLVAGRRGIGKTRLVDQALNLESEDGPQSTNGPGASKHRARRLLDYVDRISGTLGERRRYVRDRNPREVKRVILPVDLDPLFPYQGSAGTEGGAQTASGEGNGSPAAAGAVPDPEHVVGQLIKNMVFVLTSALGPRPQAQRSQTGADPA